MVCRSPEKGISETCKKVRRLPSLGELAVADPHVSSLGSIFPRELEAVGGYSMEESGGGVAKAVGSKADEVIAASKVLC